MKLSKTARLIVIIVIVAVVLGVLFPIYFRQAGERDGLNDKMDRAQILMTGLSANKESLEDELAQAQSSLSTSLAGFPESVESIEYDDDLFKIADDCNVGISSITALPPTNKKVGAVTFTVSTFTIMIKGSMDNILDFIDTIRIGDDFQLPWSAEVTWININISKSTATMTLNIYGYEG
jgi:hypothetical protein